MRISDWSSDVCSSDLAYVLADAPDHNPQVLLLASGSEVSLCVAAYEQLLEQGVHARVVSMPSWELFEAQSQEYRDQVLPPAITARVSVEQASGFGWERYTGMRGTILGKIGKDSCRERGVRDV